MKNSRTHYTYKHHQLQRISPSTPTDQTIEIKSAYSLLCLIQVHRPAYLCRRRRVRRIEELEVQSQAFDGARGDTDEKGDFAVAARICCVFDVCADAGGVLGRDALAGDHDATYWKDCRFLNW